MSVEFVIKSDNFYIFTCPHCGLYIQVHKDEINCRIFRHAIYKNNFLQINPHTSEDECNKLKETGQVYGCTKPFMLVKYNDQYMVQICGYI